MSKRWAQLSLAAVGCALVAVPAYAAPTPGPGPNLTPTVSAPANSGVRYPMRVRYVRPQTPTSPLTLVYSGLPPGAEIHASAGRRTGEQAETDGAGLADAQGRAEVRLPAPGGRWPSGATYRYGTMGFVDSPRWEQTITGRFTTATWSAPAASTRKPAAGKPKPPDKPRATHRPRTPEKQHGLAKTGV